MSSLKLSHFSCKPLRPSYFLGGLSMQDVNIFIVVVLLFAFDFWTVKNVTGRLLVGLKWWSEID